MNFGELKNDVNFVSRMQAFDESLAAIRDQLERGLAKDTSQMTKEDKIKHDLFIIYSLNTLYLLYAKINGADVQKHPIQNELSRIRLAMVREKQYEERNTIRPKLNVPVAGRFIKHGLWDPNENKPKSAEKDL